MSYELRIRDFELFWEMASELLVCQTRREIPHEYAWGSHVGDCDCAISKLKKFPKSFFFLGWCVFAKPSDRLVHSSSPLWASPVPLPSNQEQQHITIFLLLPLPPSFFLHKTHWPQRSTSELHAPTPFSTWQQRKQRMESLTVGTRDFDIVIKWLTSCQ